MVKNFEKIFLSFFLFVLLASLVFVATVTITTAYVSPPLLSEQTGSLHVNQISGNVILPGNVTYPDGTACTLASQCAGGFCNSGVCASSAPSSPSGGGTTTGGGTGGVSSGPINVTETENIGNVTAGGSASVNVTNSNQLKIFDINITFNTSVSDANVQISESSAPGSNFAISSDIGLVYKYLQITKTNINDSDISSVTIDFKVEKSWITANGIDPSTITLKRLVGGTWTDLPTVKTGEDATYIYFQATSPGLSLFAITGQKAVATSTTSTSIPQATTSTSTSTVIPTPFNWSPVWLGIFLLTVIFVAGIFLWKRKPVTKAMTTS